jgi:hypothetical protein
MSYDLKTMFRVKENIEAEGKSVKRVLFKISTNTVYIWNTSYPIATPEADLNGTIADAKKFADECGVELELED